MGVKMVIDYRRDEQSAEERREEREVQPAKKGLPIHQLLEVNNVVRMVNEEESEKSSPIAQAVRARFSNGLSGELGGGSPVAGLLQIAETAEQSITAPSPEVEERLGRFPELRDVEVPTGAAARFPELAAEPHRADAQSDVEEEDALHR
jgi:hypothetical protein